MAQPLCFIGSIDHDGSWISNAVDRVVQKRFDAVHDILADHGKNMVDILGYVKDISATLQRLQPIAQRPAAHHAGPDQSAHPRTQIPKDAPRAPSREHPIVHHPATSSACPAESKSTHEVTLHDIAKKVARIQPDERFFINAKTPPTFLIEHPPDTKALDPQPDSREKGSIYQAGKPDSGQKGAKGKTFAASQGKVGKGATGGKSRPGAREAPKGDTSKGKGAASTPKGRVGAKGTANKVQYGAQADVRIDTNATMSGATRKRQNSPSPMNSARMKAPRTVAPTIANSPSLSSTALPQPVRPILYTPKSIDIEGASESASEDLMEAMASLLDLAQKSPFDEEANTASTASFPRDPNRKAPCVSDTMPNANSAMEKISPSRDSPRAFPSAANGMASQEIRDVTRALSSALNHAEQARPLRDAENSPAPSSEKKPNEMARKKKKPKVVDAKMEISTPIAFPSAPSQPTRSNEISPTRDNFPSASSQPTRDNFPSAPSQPTRPDFPSARSQPTRQDFPSAPSQPTRDNFPSAPSQPTEERIPNGVSADTRINPGEAPAPGEKPARVPMKRKKIKKVARNAAVNAASTESVSQPSGGKGARKEWVDSMYETPQKHRSVSLPPQSKTDVLSFMGHDISRGHISNGELQF